MKLNLNEKLNPSRLMYLKVLKARIGTILLYVYTQYMPRAQWLAID